MRGNLFLFLLSILSTGHAAVWTCLPAEELFNNIDRIEHKNIHLPATGSIKLGPALLPVASLEETSIYQIAADRPGNLYLTAGTALYRKPRGSNRLQKIYQDEANELLALAVLPDGTIFFGTTPDGKIYRTAPGGTPQPIALTGATYISSLLPAPDRTLICATGAGGELLRLHPDGRQQTIFTAPQAHLTALCWLQPGSELLVGTAPEGIVYRLTFSTPDARPRITVFYDTPLEEVRTIVADGRDRIYIAGNSNPESGGQDGQNRPAVFALDRAGILTWQWSCPDSVIYNLYLDDSQRLFVLTGNRGIIYALDSAARPAILARVEESGITGITQSGRNVFFGTASPARLYSIITAAHADSGSLTSLPFDCGNPAQFGQLQIRGSIPAGTELVIATRSGNSATPDSTWSNWQPLNRLPGKVASPPARFIQWRASFTTRFPDRTPELERVDLFYRPVNRAPVINRLEISQVAEVDARRGNPQFRRQISWDATDPDTDSLVFALFIRAEKENNYQPLDTSLTETRYELDTRTIPDGWYYLRLVASDRIDRPFATALTAERISAPFVIDNTPPRITNLNISSRRVIWQVIDELSPIASCRIAINAGTWLPLEPDDGIYDEATETFTYQIPAGVEVKTVAIWASDALGNTATAQKATPAR